MATKVKPPAKTAPPKVLGNGRQPLLEPVDFRERLRELKIRLSVDEARVLASINKITANIDQPVINLSREVQATITSLKPETKRFHGAKVSLAWFPFPWVISPCRDMFGR